MKNADLRFKTSDFWVYKGITDSIAASPAPFRFHAHPTLAMPVKNGNFRGFPGIFKLQLAGTVRVAYNKTFR
ncbi:MAG: hypothetical protein ACYC6A_15440 [Armatimonadota bacterium]